MFRTRAMSDISERFPMDFLGATQSEGEPSIFYFSTNEDQYGDRMSASSMWVVSSSMKDYTGEVAMMAQRFERQLANPTPIPSSEVSSSQKRSSTPWPSLPPFSMFDQRYFNLGRGSGPEGCDGRMRSFCRNLVLQLNTPFSPPAADRGPSCEPDTSDYSYSTDTVSVETVLNHFNGMALAENSESLALPISSDCVICGKSVQQIQEETVNDCLGKTVVLGETLAETEARRGTFLDGISAGTFLPMPGGVSQAAACDRYWYS